LDGFGSNNNQHIIPQFFLRKFQGKRGTNDIIWVIDKFSGIARYQPVGEVGARYGYYRNFMDPSDPDAFDKFWRHGEETAPKVLRAIERDLVPPIRNSVDFEDLMRFFADLVIRVDEIHDHAIQIYRDGMAGLLARRDFSRAVVIDVLMEEIGDPIEEVRNELIRWILGESAQLSPETESAIHQVSLKFARDSTWENLKKKHWQLLDCQASGVSLCTSDQPVIRFDQNNCVRAGIGNYQTSILVPISTSLALMGTTTRPQRPIGIGSRKAALLYNGLMLKNSSSELYAPTDSISWRYRDGVTHTTPGRFTGRPNPI
jgi:hypothetical protein